MMCWRILGWIVSTAAFAAPAAAQGYIQQGSPTGGYVQRGQQGTAYPRPVTYPTPTTPTRHPSYPQGQSYAPAPSSPLAAPYSLPTVPADPQDASGPQGSGAQGSQQTAQQGGESDAERRMRIELLQHSMGFGGIFSPLVKELGRPSNPSDQASDEQHSCDYYPDNAACNAHRNGDDWAADRLQRGESDPAEHDWYDR